MSYLIKYPKILCKIFIEYHQRLVFSIGVGARKEAGIHGAGGRHFKLKLGRHFNAVNNLLMQFHRLIEILVVSLLQINTYGIL